VWERDSARKVSKGFPKEVLFKLTYKRYAGSKRGKEDRVLVEGGG
jgi:hypothetical protein